MSPTWIHLACALTILLAPMSGHTQSLSPAGSDEVRVFELSIENRDVAVAGDVIRVTQGQKVELRWTSDETTSIHLHGYDLEIPLNPGAPAVLSFDAHATGRFPITAHGFGHGTDHEDHGETTLLYLEVLPR